MKTMFIVAFGDGTYQDRHGRKTPLMGLAELFGRSCDAKNSSNWHSAYRTDKTAKVVPVNVSLELKEAA